MNGHTECLKVLIQNADDRDAVDCIDELERTPLMVCVANGHMDAAILLLNEFGANINSVDTYHRTALHRAVGAFFIVIHS